MARPARPSDPALPSGSLPGRCHGMLPSGAGTSTDTASDVRYERMNAGDLVAERFEIEKLAATGGMGDVFRARDRRTGEVVALKVLHGPGARYAARFAREAQVLAEL